MAEGLRERALLQDLFGRQVGHRRRARSPSSAACASGGERREVAGCSST
jgi:hypothetical protein